MSKFKIQKHTTLDKRFRIFGPDGFELIVDYDDVNHKLVDRGCERLVNILNEHWGEESLYRDDDFLDEDEELD